MSKNEPTYLSDRAASAAGFAVVSFSRRHMVNSILPMTLVWRDGTAKQRERK